MKVLLVGDYSSVHRILRDGLRSIGVEAIVASGGDFWKDLERDVDLGEIVRSPHVLGAIAKRFHLMKKIGKFDVVQFVNPFYMFGRFIFLNRVFMKRVRRVSRKMFFLSCASDAYYWRITRRKVPYGIFDDFLKYDLKKKVFWMESMRSYQYNKWVVEISDGIIPLAYEYYLAYEEHEKCLPPLPFPVNIDEISYRENVLRGKLLVYHGATRPGFKGSYYIRKAFEMIQEKYPHDIQCVVGGKLPFSRYLQVLKNFNVIVDQTSGLSWGMNALQSMAAGRIVLGGNERPARELYGLREDEVPIVNIRPDVESIVRALEWVLENRRRIAEWGWRSRKFVEKFHDYRRVAKAFVQAWGGISS